MPEAECGRKRRMSFGQMVVHVWEGLMRLSSGQTDMKISSCELRVEEARRTM